MTTEMTNLNHKPVNREQTANNPTDKLLENIESQRAELEVRAKAMDAEKLKANIKPNPLEAINEEIEKTLAEDKSLYLQWKIDVWKPVEEPDYLLRQTGIGTLPKGDIQAIKAKSKQGKTFVCSVLMASVLGCTDFGFESTKPNAKVVYFDTEQNEANTVKVGRRVYYLCKWPEGETNERLTVLGLRGAEIADRLPIIEAAIKDVKPDFAVIDGVADLIPNFNDIEESSNLINKLMEITKEANCALCCVLHTNKAQDDEGMKGHLGTLLQQKASDVFSAKKDNDTINVTETDCRNRPVNDFAFSIDGHGIPYPTETSYQAQAEQKQRAKEEELRELFRTCFKDDSEMKACGLANKIATIKGVTDRTGRNRIKEGLSRKIIIPVEGKVSTYKMAE